VHQRDQRRDHQRRAFADQRRQLVAERLARARRHHRERALPHEDARNDLFLDSAKGVESEGLFEDRVRVGHELIE
jgi:hypothetical protein